MTKEERAQLLTALDKQEDKDDWEDCWFFFQLVLFTVLCFALAWTLQAVIL